jgi:hypothetical protein
VLGLWVIGMGLGVTATAQAANSAGPYYAMPAWDQKLACTTAATCPRFIVLTDWNSEAVLDRETGLVWQKSPFNFANTWGNARGLCTGASTGGRAGWRLPSVHELASLVDPANSSPSLPTGHPFLDVQLGVYWSATTNAEFPALAWAAGFANNGSVFSTAKTNLGGSWCVRGGMNADQY